MFLNIKKIWDTLLPSEKTKSFYLVFLMFTSVLFETMGVGLIVPYVTYLVDPKLLSDLVRNYGINIDISNISELKVLIYGVIFLSLFFLIKNLFLAYFGWWQTKFSTDIRISVAGRLFNKYLFNDYAFHLKTNSAILIKNVSAECGRFMNTVQRVLIIITEIFIIIGLAILLFMIEPIGLSVSLIVMGLATSIFYLIARLFISRWAKLRVYHEGEMVKHLMQGLSGIKDIKILNREKSFSSNFNEHNFKFAIADRWYNTLQLLPKLWLEILAVMMLSILIVVVKLAGHGSSYLVPIIAAFAVAAFRIIPSMNRILGALQLLRYSFPSIQIIYEELKDFKKDNFIDNLKINKVKKLEFENEIILKDVCFSYDQSKEINLDSINIKIDKNQFIGIVGPSGAGKSTLVDVILGLLKPSRGQVLVDGKDISRLGNQWQSIIGYVPQEIYLTDDTIERNIAFGLDKSDIDIELLEKCLKASQVKDFINSLPDGIETFVGERGVRISGGQLQRIGIARALYNKPSILVLDEATSSLDIETERNVMEGINDLKGSITIISISHRLSTVEKCDKIISIKDGKIK